MRDGHGPAKVTRLRWFAVGVLKSFQKPEQHVPEMMRQLACGTRQVLDYLRLTASSSGAAANAAWEQIGPDSSPAEGCETRWVMVLKVLHST